MRASTSTIEQSNFAKSGSAAYQFISRMIGITPQDVTRKLDDGMLKATGASCPGQGRHARAYVIARRAHRENSGTGSPARTTAPGIEQSIVAFSASLAVGNHVSST